jgi:cell wall-associated NlpC family hydrolase
MQRSIVMPRTIGGASGPVVSKASLVRLTHASLSASDGAVLSGQSIVFTGKLTYGAADTPAPNQSVRLEQSASGEWKTVGAAVASADGSVNFTVKPTASTSYRLAYAGVRSFSPSVSPEQSVTVKLPAPTTSSSSSSGSGSWTPTGLSTLGANHNPGSATAQAVVAAAAAQTGKPYVYAAAGPNAFDCSGLVQYVLAQVGVSVPHNADSQMGYGTAVSFADAAPGDLIFFLDGGYAYHVGIYAGGTQMYDAPNSSTPVGLHTIYSSNIAIRRIV